MTACWRSVSESTTRRQIVLLDTEDPFDAQDTGREGPESPHDGEGLRITYDGTGTIPCVSILGPDGEIEFRGFPEIRASCAALRVALRYAEAFGPPIPYDEWRQLHG